MFRLLPLLVFWLLTGCTTRIKHMAVNGDSVRMAQQQHVEVLRDGVSIPAHKRLKLEPGDEISTGPGALLRLRLKGGGTAILFPESQMALGSIHLKLGKLLLQLHRAFEVYVPGMAAGVTGTEFLSETTDGTDLIITVLDGSVRLHAQDGSWSQTVGSRQQASATAAGGVSAFTTLTRDDYNALVTDLNKARTQVGGRSPSLGVPDLLLTTEDEAVILLANAGFVLGTREPVIADGIAWGLVAGQNPTAGASLRAGRGVNIQVSAEPVKVPDLMGSDPTTAQTKASRQGLIAEDVGTPTITGAVPANTVNWQNPVVGNLAPKGGTVKYRLEAESVVVPAVVGEELGAALKVLEYTGLSPSYTSTLSAGHDHWTVLSQSIAAGTRVTPGTELAMQVAEPAVSVPDLVNNYMSRVLPELTRLGLNLIVTGPESSGCLGAPASWESRTAAACNAAVIHTQDPAEDTTVAIGSTVNVTLRSGPD